MGRIKDKIKQIDEFMGQLQKMAPHSIEEYKSDLKTKAACERYFEKIVEATIDLAFLVIKIKKFDAPQDDSDAFNILLKKKIIDDKLATRLKAAKGMRNIIIHEYGKIDDDMVFHSITEELEGDIDRFVKDVEKTT